MEAGCSEGQGCGILREPRAVAAQGGGGGTGRTSQARSSWQGEEARPG